MDVERWDEERDGALTESALSGKLEDLGYSVSRYTYPPGCSFPPHTHEVDKIDAVLAGRFRITMHDESVVLEPGEWVAVPRGAVHAAEVVGDEPVVSLDAIRHR